MGLVDPNPTERAKNDVERSLLVEAHGGPLAAMVAGANVRVDKLLTLDAVVAERPKPTGEALQHLRLDKGHDQRSVRGDLTKAVLRCPHPTD
jgi:hypothetical protein